MAMRRPRIKAAANISIAKRKPKITAVEAKSTVENNADEDGRNVSETLQDHVVDQQTEKESSEVPVVTAKEPDAITEVTSVTTQLNEVKPPSLENGSSESTKKEPPTTSSTRRPRIRAAANVIASTKRRSKPGLNAQIGTKVTEDLKDESNASQQPVSSDPPAEEQSKSLTENIEDPTRILSEKANPTVDETETVENNATEDGETKGKTNQNESSTASAATTNLSEENTPIIENGSSEKATADSQTSKNQQSVSTTRRPRVRAAANVVASAKRRSKPGLTQTNTKVSEDLGEEQNANTQSDGIDAPGTEDKAGTGEGKTSSLAHEATERILTEDIERLLDTASSTAGVVEKPAIDDSASFKCPSNIEYSGLHNHHSTATATNACSEELMPTEYDGVLQSDLQKSLLGPPMSPMSPMSPSKVLSRQRIRATPHFGQRRNSFVGSSPSPHTGDDAAPPCDNHPPSSPYHYQRRDRHYSGPNTPFSTMASPAMSLGGGSGHYGSPHKYAPLIPSGRIRTESSCSAFSDFVGGQKVRKQDENQARRRDFEARFTNGVPDKASIKMSDLIYYNPVTNPMATKPKMQIKTEEKGSGAVDLVDPKTELKEEKPDEDTAMPVPQLKLNADGELILDDASLEIETTAGQEARKMLAKSSLIYLDENTGMNGFYKRHKRTKDWEPDETIKFYRCLQTLGTDFSLMCQLFPKRTRRDLKLKFKKEERCNAALINKALLYPKAFNIDELTKQLEQEEIEREEAEKRWKSIKAANPKYVSAIKQKQGNSSSASRILSRGENIYDNENIVKGKLGKRALSAQKKKANDTPKSERPQPKPTRKRKIKEETAVKQCEETPSKQKKEAADPMEVDDDELSKGISDLLDMPSMDYLTEEVIQAVTTSIENADGNEFALSSPTKVSNENVESSVTVETAIPPLEEPSVCLPPIEVVLQQSVSPTTTTSSNNPVLHAPVEVAPVAAVSLNSTTTVTSPSSLVPEHTLPLTEESVTSMAQPGTPSVDILDTDVIDSIDTGRQTESNTTTDTPLQSTVEEILAPLEILLEQPIVTETVTSIDDAPIEASTTEALPSVVLSDSTHTLASLPPLITAMPTPTTESSSSMVSQMMSPTKPSSPCMVAAASTATTTNPDLRATPSPSPDDFLPEEVPAPCDEDRPSSPFMESDIGSIQAEHESTSSTTSHAESVVHTDTSAPASPTASQLDESHTENTQAVEMQEELPTTSKQTTTESNSVLNETIHKIVTGIVKGTLVLVSTIQPDSEELLNEVFLQDPETEELLGDPLPIPRHTIDQIVQMMADGSDDDDDETDSD